MKEFSLLKDDLCVLQFPSDYVQQNRSFEWQSWLHSLVEDSSTKKYDFSLIMITIITMELQLGKKAFKEKITYMFPVGLCRQHLAVIM